MPCESCGDEKRGTDKVLHAHYKFTCWTVLHIKLCEQLKIEIKTYEMLIKKTDETLTNVMGWWGNFKCHKGNRFANMKVKMIDNVNYLTLEELTTTTKKTTTILILSWLFFFFYKASKTGKLVVFNSLLAYNGVLRKKKHSVPYVCFNNSY